VPGRKPEARIGTSGFAYNHWRGVFYPPDVPQSRWLEHYVRHFDTVELNNTFYRLPGEKTFDSWRRRAPEGFCYTLKLSGYITHRKRLRDAGEPLGVFLSRADRLGELLGPILVQLPPHWHANAERLGYFLDLCPPRYRWAVEFRDPSWLCEAVYDVLRGHGAALCVHDLIADHPAEVTADWVYLRFHGAGQPDGCYPPRALRQAAGRIRRHLDAGLDVAAYFNNDIHGHAVANAAALRACVQGR
jgi:uncharacterized protein YecE (DUF72 family)